jgi:hypothetical protein
MTPRENEAIRTYNFRYPPTHLAYHNSRAHPNTLSFHYQTRAPYNPEQRRSCTLAANMSSSPATTQNSPTPAKLSSSALYRRINDKLKSGLVPKSADIEEYFSLHGDPIEHISLGKHYKLNADAKAQLDRIRERLYAPTTMNAPATMNAPTAMNPAPAPTYDVPATRSNKRKDSGHVNVEQPNPKKRGPGRPPKAETKVNDELLQKTKQTAQQILDANTQLATYAEEAFRVGRNMLSVSNMLADDMDGLISAVENGEHGDDVREIIRKIRKTRYDTAINNITPLFTKRDGLPSLREPLFVQLSIDNKTAVEVRDWALYKLALEQDDEVSVERRDAVTVDRQVTPRRRDAVKVTPHRSPTPEESHRSPSTPEESDDDYDDDEDIPAKKQPSGRRARRSAVAGPSNTKFVEDTEQEAVKDAEQEAIKDTEQEAVKVVAPKRERFEVPPGYIKTAKGRFKNETTKKVYDIPPGFALTQEGLFVEDSGEEE